MPYTLFHLDSERGFRGGERQLLYLAAHARRRGHDNVVVCRSGAPLQARARALGFSVMNLPFVSEWDPVSAWRLARAAAMPGAVLHAHTAHGAGLASLARRLGGPAWVAHRRVDFRLRGALGPGLKYGSAGAFIAVSKAIKDILAEDGVEARRVDVIPDSLPLGAEEAGLVGAAEPWGPSADRGALRARLGLDPRHEWVGNLAAMVPHKDQPNLLRAVPAVVARRPKTRFLIVGDGPLRPELEALADSLGVRGAVRFPGHQEDPRPWLQALDVYCQPSWGEGLGSVLLEAMACRVPIVATTAGGIPEVAKDGHSAWLVPPRDPAALASALLAALDGPAEAGSRAAAAARSLTRFSLAATGDAALAVDRRLLEAAA
ncbi:MAG: glycosyltransferase [Elusimicrobia bacterium]|nr:glycosyltransferase [Elusimicrobiota bacterium]